MAEYSSAMTDWDIAGGLKVQRAKDHIEDLAARIQSFRERHPYCAVVKPNPKGQPNELVFRVREEMPTIWGAIAADAIHNLRSSLDLLWRAATIGDVAPSRREGHRNHFPCGSAAKNLDARLRGAVKPATQRAMHIAKQAAMYEGGNDHLWNLHCAWDTDKHEMPILAAVRGGTTPPESRALHLIWPPALAPTIKEGASAGWYFSMMVADAVMDVEIEVAFDVTFGESRPLKGKEVLTTLATFRDEVERIFKAFVVAGLVGPPPEGGAHRDRSG